MSKKAKKRSESLETRFHAAKKCRNGDKKVDFDDDEVTDVIDLALTELRRTSKEGLEKVKRATKTLRDMPVFRAPEEADG